MESKIKNPFEWEGHEVEAMLATESGKEGKKNCALFQ